MDNMAIYNLQTGNSVRSTEFFSISRHLDIFPSPISLYSAGLVDKFMQNLLEISRLKFVYLLCGLRSKRRKSNNTLTVASQAL